MTATDQHPPDPPEPDGDARDVRPDLDEDAAQDEARQPGVDPDWSQTTDGAAGAEEAPSEEGH